MAGEPKEKTEDRIRIEPARRAVSVAYHDAVVASSIDALILRDNGYEPVFYIPKSDVRMDLLEPTDRHTTCPWKGEARYWSVKVDGSSADNAVWAYDEPKPGVAVIADHVAFDPSKVTVKAVSGSPP